MDIVTIIDRIKTLKSLESDTAIADLLGIKRSAFAERKRRSSIPYEELVSFCEREGLNIDWLLTGEGEARKVPVVKYSRVGIVTEDCAQYHTEKDPEIHEIVELLEHDLPEMKKYLLKFLRGTKDRKEGAQGLGLPNLKNEEE